MAENTDNVKVETNDTPPDIQHEEEMTKDAEGVSTLSLLKEIKEDQQGIIDAMKEIVSFIKDLAKTDYEEEVDGKKVQKAGLLWTLIKRAKKIGAF